MQGQTGASGFIGLREEGSGVQRQAKKRGPLGPVALAVGIGTIK